MAARQTLDFTALESQAVRLLNKKPEVRARLAAQYRVAMIDESQDVNPQQDRLFDAMGVARTMVVGDAQQSIYGFRGAEVALFRARTRNGSYPLTRNWRSEAGILRFVDHVFAPLWPEYAPMAPSPAPFRLDDAPIAQGFEGVELWRHNAVDPSATAVYVREMLEDGVRPGETAVLVRSAAAAQRLKNGLDGEGIPARIAGGSERFYTRLEVRDLSNALRAVADPYDDYALLCALRSPIAGLSLDAIVHLAADGGGVVERLDPDRLSAEEDRARLAEFLRWYTPLSKVADRLPAGEALAEVFAASPFLTAMARREEARAGGGERPQAPRTRPLGALARAGRVCGADLGGPGSPTQGGRRARRRLGRRGDPDDDPQGEGARVPRGRAARHDAGLPERAARRADRLAPGHGDGASGQGPATCPPLRRGGAREARRGGGPTAALRRAHPRPAAAMRVRLPAEPPPVDEHDPRAKPARRRPARRSGPGRDGAPRRGLVECRARFDLYEPGSRGATSVPRRKDKGNRFSTNASIASRYYTGTRSNRARFS